jgi:hypothetical protein
MNQQIETMEDYAVALEELASSIPDTNPDFRANVPAGTDLAQTNLGVQGMVVKWKKADSGMNINGKALPDRIPLYNKLTGDVSMVPPTIGQKRFAEHPGVYTFRRPEDFPTKTPIDETCPICTRGRGGNKRPFYDLYDLENHMQVLHPREHAAALRTQEQAERREDRQLQRDLVAAIRPTTFDCDQCDFISKSSAGLSAHKRSHGN